MLRSRRDSPGPEGRRRSAVGEDAPKKVIGASSRLYPGPGGRRPTLAQVQAQRRVAEEAANAAPMTTLPSVQPANKVALPLTVATLCMPAALTAKRTPYKNQYTQHKRNIYGANHHSNYPETDGHGYGYNVGGGHGAYQYRGISGSSDVIPWGSNVHNNIRGQHRQAQVRHLPAAGRHHHNSALNYQQSRPQQPSYQPHVPARRSMWS